MTEKGVSKLSVKDLDLAGKRVLIRVDFNVPLRDGKVEDDTRIQAALPTIRHAKEAGARVILASHLGRPKGEKKPEFSLAPVAARLGEILGKKVAFAPDCIGEPAVCTVESMEKGSVALLENVRYYKGETSNDPQFAKQLASLADEYVNDAFGTAHRAHGSTVGVPQALGRGAAGFLIDRELNALSRALYSPEKPVVAIFGGAKISDKIPVIETFLDVAQVIILGGGMLFTFLKAQGKEIGKSLLEEDRLEFVARLMKTAESKGVDLVLPTDVVTAKEFSADAEGTVVSVDDIAPESLGLDIGPESIALFRKKLSGAKTIIWNGPMGVFEIEQFSHGTVGIAKAVASSDAFSVVGGGDSVSAVKKAGIADKVSHISTGGGASLQFLSGKKLPGIEILTDKE